MAVEKLKFSSRVQIGISRCVLAVPKDSTVNRDIKEVSNVFISQLPESLICASVVEDDFTQITAVFLNDGETKMPM